MSAPQWSWVQQLTPDPLLPTPFRPQLVELSQPLSPAMALIYESISELMDACVKELRKYNRLDASDLTVEQVG